MLGQPTLDAALRRDRRIDCLHKDIYVFWVEALSESAICALEALNE
jgi:hypothetical protein